MAYETFRVVEANERFGFARLKGEGSEELLHAELYPDDGEAPGALQLRPGDVVRGLRRGQAVSRLTWVTKAPPPEELVQKLGEAARALAQAGFTAVPPAHVLAERSWRRARDVGELEAELAQRLPTFFDDQLHPFDDEELLARTAQRMQAWVPGLSIAPDPAAPRALKVEPGGHPVVPLEASREDPLPTFVPLVDRLNALLEAAGAKERWVRVHRDWRLGEPALIGLLVRQGVLAGALLN